MSHAQVSSDMPLQSLSMQLLTRAYTDTFRSRFSEAASRERAGHAQQQMSVNTRFGPTRTLCLDFEASLYGSSHLLTIDIGVFCFKKPLAAGARKLVSRLLFCSVQQRGLELGYIEHKPRGGLVYSALQSAWHGFFSRDFSSWGAVVNC
jgi:hypothetical protein